MANPSFVYVTYIATTPEKLWQALIDGAFTRQYWAGTVIESDWKVGAPMRLSVEGTAHDHSGVVLAFDPYRRLSYSWHVEFHEVFRREKPSRVTFEIEPMGDVCKLTVIHSGFEGETATYHQVTGGWPLIVASLKSLLETGQALSASQPRSESAV